MKLIFGGPLTVFAASLRLILNYNKDNYLDLIKNIHLGDKMCKCIEKVKSL
jgi:hypothetical protein